MGRLLYNLLLHAFAAPALLALYGPRVALGGKYRRSWKGKLGGAPRDFPRETLPQPRVWFHAVSVGEAAALAPVVHDFARCRPNASIIVSTGTETGQDAARSLIQDADAFLYMPLDFPFLVNRTVSRAAPDLCVLMETELWPNLIHSLAKRGSLIALANGRISDRSFPRYRKLRPWLAPTLNHIALFLMSSELDAVRVREMGAPPDRIHTVGNTKLDAAFGEVAAERSVRLRRLLDVPEGSQVIVAGSVHPGEYEAIFEAYRELIQEFPELILIVAPRHVERTHHALHALRAVGLPEPYLRSDADAGLKRGDKTIVIFDKTGELLPLYALASVVFVGGSLVPLGGQNILEPAACAKVVVFGPSMEDFRDARDILMRAGAGIQVADRRQAQRALSERLRDPQGTRERGIRGRNAILAHRGASARTASLISGLLEPSCRAPDPCDS